MASARRRALRGAVRALAANQQDALGLALKVASPVSALSAASNLLQRMLPTKHGHDTLARLQNAVQHAVDIVQRHIEIEETSKHIEPSQQHPSAMTTAETTREKEAASSSRDSSNDEPPDVRDDTNVGNALEALLSEARQQALLQRRTGKGGDAGQLSLAMGQAVGAALRARALKQHAIGRVPISHVDLAPLAKQVAIDICALTLEKHGVTPEVDIQGAAVACAQVTSASYILTEVLKNAIAATVKRHGIDSDWAPPVRITISDEHNDEHTEIVVHDDGFGLDDRKAPEAFSFFFTSTKAEEPSYTFSGNFGGSLEGAGVGLPLALQHASMWGGDLCIGLPWISASGGRYQRSNATDKCPKGAIVRILLPKPLSTT